MPTEGSEFKHVPEPEPEASPYRPVVLRSSSKRGEFIHRNADAQDADSALDRFHRLKSEVLELSSTLNRTAAADVAAAPEDAAQTVTGLQASLGALSNDTVLRAHATPGENTALPGKQSFATAIVDQAAQAPDGSANAQYDLYFNPAERSQFLEFDRRVAALTKLVGNQQTGVGSVLARLTDLNARLAMTEEFRLDAVAERTRSLITEIDTVELPEPSRRQHSADENAEAARKLSVVNQLHDNLLSLDAVMDGVPNLVERLTTQKDLHKGARDSLGRLERLEQTQQAVNQVLAADQTTLSQMSAQVTTDLGITNANIQHLQARMEALSKRMN